MYHLNMWIKILKQFQLFKGCRRQCFRVCYTCNKAECLNTRKLSEKHPVSVKDMISQCDKKLLSQLEQNGYVYVIDSKDAESIAFHLTEDWKGFIFEANPGPGILSKAILSTGISHLRVFEKNEEFYPALKILSTMYSNFEIIEEDMMLLATLDARSSFEESIELDKFFQGIPKLSWSDGVPFRLFSVILSKRSIKFLRYLLAVLPTGNSIFAHGRCEFFFLVSEAEYMYMTAEPKKNFSTYRWTTVVYNLFFEIKCLKKFSSYSFFPLPASREEKKMTNEHCFYLVQLTPKPDLFSSLVTNNKLTELYFFVRHHLVKRRALVIPTMESWIPFSGPRLIKEGMNVFTKFGDLSPKQILSLFNQFSSWPEYEDTTFHAALRRYYERRSLPDEDDKNIK